MVIATRKKGTNEKCDLSYAARVDEAPTRDDRRRIMHDEQLVFDHCAVFQLEPPARPWFGFERLDSFDAIWMDDLGCVTLGGQGVGARGHLHPGIKSVHQHE